MTKTTFEERCFSLRTGSKGPWINKHVEGPDCWCKPREVEHYHEDSDTLIRRLGGFGRVAIINQIGYD